ncbi:MAG: hypothetical protein ACI4Q9_02020 [Candidatus Methanomethylophilaceae archaeon]
MTRDTEMIPAIAVAELHGDMGGSDADTANAAMISFLSEISKGCGRIEGAVIGHNKANFTCGDDLLSISCTTEDGNVRTKCVFSSSVGRYDGVVNVIVYGTSYGVLKGLIEGCAHQCLPGCSVRVESDGGCDDPECNDPDCRDPDHRRGVIRIEGL